jgi:arsenate reductase-like glutaredoxin family protein
MKHLRLSEPEVLAKVEQEPRLLKLPLARTGQKLAIGRDEAAWKGFLAG